MTAGDTHQAGPSGGMGKAACNTSPGHGALTAQRFSWRQWATASCALGVILLVMGVPAQASTASVASPPDAVSGETNPGGDVPIMIVLDLSGSMNDDDGTGTIKLDGAKAALAEVSRDIAPGTPVGLWTYPGSGRNSQDGCSLGEANFALGTLDPALIGAEIDALTADGDTPTGPALEAAIDHMKATGRTSGLVILVSDGLSNCGKPPCDVARQAQADGFDITAAVAGFQVSAEGRAELECVANSTGGVYVDVEDSGELRKAVTSFVGVTLDVEVEGLDATLVGGMRQQVKVAVTNTSRTLAAQDISLSLAFTDAGKLTSVAAAGGAPATVFPPVLPPRVKLGNLPPGASRAHTWAVSVPMVTTQSVAAPRLTVQSITGLPSLIEGKWSIANGQLSLADAGPILRDAKSVVILGDSYSSGEGTFDYLTGDATARDSCHRSLQTYGLILFAADGRLSPEDGSAIVACSGAVTQDFFQPNEDVAPQSDQLGSIVGDAGAGPDVAVMTFGGNDIGFADVVKACAWANDCTTFSYQENSRDAPRPWTSVKFNEAASIQSRLTRLYSTVAAQLNSEDLRAQRGGRWVPLVVLPYPQVLATNSSCSNFTSRERDFGIQLGQTLNLTVELAVAEAVKQGLPVYYAAGVSDAVMPDHTACAGEGKRWINPISVNDALYGTFVNEQMHPNTMGYAAMTAALVQWSQGQRPLAGPFQLPPDANAPELSRLARLGASLNQLTVSDDAVEVDMNAPQTDVEHQAAPGQPLRVTASGFDPNSNVRVVMRSDPRTLGIRTADEQGQVDDVVLVPSDMPRGEHELQMDGVDAAGELVVLWQPITVVTPIAWWIWGVLGASAAALALGAVLLWRGSRAPGSRTVVEPSLSGHEAR